MNLQNRTLAEFKRVYGNPSMQKMSDLTGLNLTRIFRIQNGKEMKLKEYEMFHKLILKRSLSNDEQFLSDKFFEFQNKMSKRAKQDLILHMTRKINHKNLLIGPQNKQNKQLAS